jgi:hypothetical protein
VFLSWRFGALSERALATAVIAVAQIVATLLFAGLVLQSLSTETVLVMNVIVTGAIGFAMIRSRDRREHLAVTHALRGGVRRLAQPFRDAWALMLLSVAFLETVYLALAVYTLPSAAWDAVQYHLVAVGAWFRADHILVTPLNLFANVYPMNGELASLWVLSLSHSDVFIELPQLGFAILGALAVATIARCLGVSRAGAVVAGTLYLLTPTVVAQATTNYVDLVMPALFLAGFAFLLRYVFAGAGAGAQVVAWPRLVLAGIAIGLAAGSKSTGVLYALVAAVVLLANLVGWQRAGAITWGDVGRRFGIFLLPVVALGSFWYVRTWVEYGTPTYPFSVSIGPVQVFDGPYGLDFAEPPSTFRHFPRRLWPLVSWARLTPTYTYDQRLAGLGPQWLLVELPALVVFTFYCARRRRTVLWNFLLPVFVMTALTPENWWARYTLVFLAAGAVAVPFVVERVKRRQLRLALQGGTVLVVLVGCVLSAKRFTFPQPSFSATTVVSDATKPRSERTFGKLVLPEFAWTDSVPRDSRVGVLPADFPDRVGALFGSDFRNDVIALSSRNSTSASLLPALRAKKIDYLVTRTDTALDAVASSHEEALRLISSNAGVHAYRVLPRRTSEPE